MKHLLVAVLVIVGLTSLFGETVNQANAFGPLKQKLQAGQDAVLFINGDSTAYSEFGPYYKFAEAIGEETKSKVVLHRWAEWEGSKPTGPKEYAPPVVLNEGSGGGTLTVYLAALPGGVAGDMFESSRFGKALQSIPRPDCAILHQGHNMLNTNRAFKGDTSTARGLILSALGNTAAQWPGIPQVIVTQNPLKSSDRFQLIYDPIRDAAALQPGVQLIDSYQLFLDAGKRPELYRDDIHPSDQKSNDAGAAMINDALLAAWRAAVPATAGDTKVWSEKEGENLISNGDFSEWNSNTPVGWSVVAGASIEQVTADGAPALALYPNGSQFSGLNRIFSEDELAKMSGKIISVAALVRSSPSQPRPMANVVCPVQGETRTFAFGDLNKGRGEWVWLVTSGIPIDDADLRNKITLRFYPAFDVKPPENNEPLLIRRIIVVEGPLPFGRLPSQ